MCSIGDDIEENLKYMTKSEKFKLGSKCNKCKEQIPCVVLRSKDCYCKDCFLNATVHKFKALLGKHRLIRPNDRVLIYHKTGHASTALLHFIRSGLDLNTPKKLKFEPIFLFIENHPKLSLKNREKLLEDTSKQLKHFNFPLYFISITPYLAENKNINVLLKENYHELILNENDGKLIGNVLEKWNQTMKIDYLHLIEKEILTKTAKFLNCQFVFTPELSIDIASQLLTNISLGRGSHVPIDTGFCDDRDAEIKILRPLRNFDIKELVFYNVYNGLESLISSDVPRTSPSIQGLIRNFVSDLQTNYPATVATVSKTGDKLALNANVVTRKCKMCQGSLECKNDALTSAESTSFSHWISTSTRNDQELYENFQYELSNDYCYSCNKFML